MSGFLLTSKGDFSKTEKFLNSLRRQDYINVLDKYAQEGVRLLSGATPQDTGKTASSWGYEIEKKGDQTAIWFTNSNVNNGCNIAIILQYGHGTGTGGYVAGKDYINPVLQPLFDKMANAAWEEVMKL